MINAVSLTGRLTRDPELRETQNGVAVGNMTLAVNRTFTDANGERQADFINCVMFKKTTEIAKKYLNKGSLVGISGRLQSRSYEDKDSKRVFVTEVVVDNLAFLETRAEAEANRSQGQSSNHNPPQQQRGQREENPFNNNAVDISDEDLPF